jgi:predicted membrane channel-forming protein YqfA (hemolysin III family)
MALAYSSVALVFFSTLYGNIKILEHAGVNAFIIVRSCTPFAVCVLDYCFLGRTLPNARSSIAMITTAASCFIYISMKGGSSTEWGVDSLFWCAAWYSMFVFDQVFIKAIVDKYPASGWERTLYQVGCVSSREPFPRIIPSFGFV